MQLRDVLESLRHDTMNVSCHPIWEMEQQTFVVMDIQVQVVVLMSTSSRHT